MFRFNSKCSALWLGLVVALLLPIMSQAQMELGAPDIWYSNPAVPAHPNAKKYSSSDLIGNHPRLLQDSVQAAIDRFQALPQRGHTIFLVVRPNYLNPSGKTYLRCKGLEITDSEILYRGVGREFVPDKKHPLILSASFPAYSQRGGRPAAPKIDTSLFKVAEVIAYNRFFSKEDLRLMEAYLSLKYSIPTTKNENKSLRSYPSDSASAYYWTPSRDKVYDREVIALGNFGFSGLQQSQTVAYHDDSLIIALDTIVPFGQMPQRYMQEGAFLIMSKRIDQSSTYDCELALNQQFPITAWRLRTQNFNAMGDSLRLFYPDHQATAFNDTIILTDGLDTLDIKVLLAGSDLAISLALADLKQNRVYRFRVKNNFCDDTASIALSPQGPGALALNVDPKALPVDIQVQDMQGMMTYDTTMYSTPMLIKVDNGQYNLWVEDQQGALQSDFLIAGNDTSSMGIKFIPAPMPAKEIEAGEQRIVVYPNPGFTGEEAHFEFHGFKAEDQIRISVYDPQGRLLHTEDLELAAGYSTWDFTLGLPGAYTFVFANQDQSDIKKLTVTKRF